MSTLESSLSYLAGYKPSDFGLDAAKFPAYRNDPVTNAEVQLEVIEFLAYSERRFACASAPVGIGKMLVAMTLAKLTGLRTAIVVPYTGLEDQYAEEMQGHLVDVRGRGNYTCGDYAHLDCKGGISMGCRYANGRGCEYDRKVDAAREAMTTVTNYDFWLNKNAYGGGLQRTEAAAEVYGANPIELLILDEGDAAADKVSEFLACRVYENEIKRYGDPRMLGDDIETWKKFVKSHAGELDAEIRTTGMELAHLGRKATAKQVDVLHGLEKLKTKFERIASIQDDWVCEERIGTKWGRMWAFDVIWPGRYTEQYLFRGIPKVVIMSGTLTSKDMALLGVKKEHYDYRQWSRIFPANRHPIYVCPPRRKVDGKIINVTKGGKNKTSDEDLREWVEWMDLWMDLRLDRKGLIGTTSYEWQEYIQEHSRHSELFVVNKSDPESGSAKDKAEEFFRLSAPRVLVSPSFGRGWDFKYKRAEWALLSKCPFVPTQSKVMQARLSKDKNYAWHLCMKRIEQFAGRPMRAPDDRGEVVLMDGHFGYFLMQNGYLGQEWFVNAVRRVGEIPKPPMKLI